MVDSVAAFLRCTLDDLVAQHPEEAARAEEFYARAVTSHQQELHAGREALSQGLQEGEGVPGGLSYGRVSAGTGG